MWMRHRISALIGAPFCSIRSCGEPNGCSLTKAVIAKSGAVCRLAADWDLLLQQPPLPAQASGFGIDWKGEPDTPLCAPATDIPYITLYNWVLKPIIVNVPSENCH